MLSKTHVAVGLAASSAVMFQIQDPKLLLTGSIALIGGCLIPDLDEEHSYLSRKLFIPSIILAAAFFLSFIISNRVIGFHKDFIIAVVTFFLLIALVFILLKLLKYYKLYNYSVTSSEIIFVLPGKLLFSIIFISFICVHKTFGSDVDSYIFSSGVLIFFLSILTTLFTIHRSFSHSLLGFFSFGLSILLLNSQVFLPFIIGYGLHTFMDICSNNGVELLFPFRKRFNAINISNGLIDQTVSTGSDIDRLIGKIALFSTPLIIALKLIPHIK